MIVANAIARQLRKILTPQEVRLWIQLRALKELGFHFRRQAPIGPYIVDFVCFKYSLVIEADGGQHGHAREAARDAARDTALAAQGFQILRFWNSDIDHNINGVMEAIHRHLIAPHPDRQEPVHPPHKGEG